MDFFLQNLLSYILVYKYAALFAVTLFAAIALPIPSAATLIASAAFASQGYFNIGWVFMTAATGNILGDNIGYWVARVYGKPLLRKIGFRKVLESPKLENIEQRVKDRPGLFIFFSRFEVIMTVSVNIISGLTPIPYKKYLTYEVLGEVFQVGIYSAFGYTFGNNWQVINSLVSKFSTIAVVVVLLLIIIFWKKISHKVRHHKEN
jgi:membrane-associated protein